MNRSTPASPTRDPFGMAALARSATTAPIPAPASGRGTSSRASQPGRRCAASSPPSYRRNCSIAGKIRSTVAVSCPQLSGIGALHRSGRDRGKCSSHPQTSTGQPTPGYVHCHCPAPGTARGLLTVAHSSHRERPASRGATARPEASPEPPSPALTCARHVGKVILADRSPLAIRAPGRPARRPGPLSSDG